MSVEVPFADRYLADLRTVESDRDSTPKVEKAIGLSFGVYFPILDRLSLAL